MIKNRFKLWCNYVPVCGSDASFSIFVDMHKLLTVLLLFLSLAGFTQEREMELWNKNQILLKPAGHLLLKASEKIHYSTVHGGISLKYAELLVGHKLNTWIEYGGGYRRSSSMVAPDSWESENRALLYFDLSEPVSKFNLGFSNRVEYRSFEHLSDYFRHRQSIKLDFPAITTWGMRFYLTEESFYKFTGDHTHLARFYAGVTVLEKKHFNFSSYYALQKSKLDSKWFSSDVVGLNLNISI